MTFQRKRPLDLFRVRPRGIGPVSFFALLTCLARFPAAAAETEGVHPPGQPETGPGGADYPHALVASRSVGENEKQYWLFFPDAPKPKRAPVVIFLHGWGATDPAPYQGWINHIVRKGSIVIYPRYQAVLRSPAADFMAHTVAAVTAAFVELEKKSDRIAADRTHVAVVGHAVGGLMAANLAAEMVGLNLPAPSAIMCVAPGRTWGSPHAQGKLTDLAKIIGSTLLLVVVGDRDLFARDDDARRIWRESASVPPENKDLLVLQSDDHGSPALVANHFAPCAPGDDYENPEFRYRNNARQRELLRQRLAQRRLGGTLPNDTTREFEMARAVGDIGAAQMIGDIGVDALDYRGTWRLFDALCDAGWRHGDRAACLGGGAAQIDLGDWSDGTPVAPIRRITEQ
jgi:dienelactone hydrolase